MKVFPPALAGIRWHLRSSFLEYIGLLLFRLAPRPCCVSWVLVQPCFPGDGQAPEEGTQKSALTGTFSVLKALLKLAEVQVVVSTLIPSPSVAAAEPQRHQHCPTTLSLHHDQGLFLPLGAFPWQLFFFLIKQTFDFFAANGPSHCASMCPSPPVPWSWIFVPGCTLPSHLGAHWGGTERKFCRI